MIAFLRRMLGLGIRPGGILAQWIFRRRIRHFQDRQRQLDVRYDLHPSTPIHSYPELQPLISDFIQRQKTPVVFAETSGTTGVPKRVPYTRQRLNNFKVNSALAGLISFQHHQVSRSDLYVLASRKQDKSFTALTMHSGRARPHWIKSLVYPSAHERDPCLAPLYAQYGGIAVRLWLMTITDPGVLYCTNPSTLAIFLQEINDSWNHHKQLLQDWASGQLPTTYEGFVARLGATRTRTALRRLAEQHSPPSFCDLFPSVQAYCSWDGGYVARYLDHIQHYIPSNIPHVSMYSMSTESVQTLPVKGNAGLGFFPIATNVRYEFLPVDSACDPRLLLEAWELTQGREYIMIISNEYGLQRYNSEDVFLCHNITDGLPDLRFKRRTGLRWSFTGEKLTAEQITEAWQQLGATQDLSAFEMTLIPSFPSDAVCPHYILCLAQIGEGVPSANIAEQLDLLLQDLNDEYQTKRESGRLGSVTLEVKPYAEVAAMLDARTQNESDIHQAVWESQFKLPPLWQKLRS